MNNSHPHNESLGRGQPETIRARQAAYRNGRWRMQVGLFTIPELRVYEARRKMQALNVFEQVAEAPVAQTTPLVQPIAPSEMPPLTTQDTAPTVAQVEALQQSRQAVDSAFEQREIA